MDLSLLPRDKLYDRSGEYKSLRYYKFGFGYQAVGGHRSDMQDQDGFVRIRFSPQPGFSWLVTELFCNQEQGLSFPGMNVYKAPDGLLPYADSGGAPLTNAQLVDFQANRLNYLLTASYVQSTVNECDTDPYYIGQGEQLVCTVRQGGFGFFPKASVALKYHLIVGSL